MSNDDWPECDLCGRPLLANMDEEADEFFCEHCDHCPMCGGIHHCKPGCRLEFGGTA